MKKGEFYENDELEEVIEEENVVNNLEPETITEWHLHINTIKEISEELKTYGIQYLTSAVVSTSNLNPREVYLMYSKIQGNLEILDYDLELEGKNNEKIEHTIQNIQTVIFFLIKKSEFGFERKIEAGIHLEEKPKRKNILEKILGVRE